MSEVKWKLCPACNTPITGILPGKAVLCACFTVCSQENEETMIMNNITNLMESVLFTFIYMVATVGVWNVY